MVFEKLEQTLYSIKIFPRQEMNKVTSPVDTGRKLNVHKYIRSYVCTFERTYVQFTSCVYWKDQIWTKYGPNTVSSHISERFRRYQFYAIEIQRPKDKAASCVSALTLTKYLAQYYSFLIAANWQ